MNLTLIKTSFYTVLMIGFLLLAFITNDNIYSQLFATLGIITGAIVNNNLTGISKIEKLKKCSMEENL
ncbi:MAG: hypothetical protein WCK82_02030 [Bacteroidota bacterium]